MYGYGYRNGNGFSGWGVPQGYATPPQQLPIMQGNQQFGQFPNGGPQVDNAVAQKPSLQVPWVNGEVGAQAYLVAPNSAVILMDSDNPVFYIKTSDISGKATIQAFRYEEIKQDSPAPISAQKMDYVTKEEFEAFKASLLNKPVEEEEKI